MTPGRDFALARRETIRYHQQFYAATVLGQTGTWLAAPHPLLGEALDLLAAEKPVTAYDLGAGVGRHTLPMLQELPAGSEVYAVDLLPSALDSLRATAPGNTATVLHTRVQDLDEFEFETAAELILAFSAIEHLPTPEAVESLLRRIAAATVGGGVVAVGVVADRREIHPGGSLRPALLESGITAAATRDLLCDAFKDFTIDDLHERPAEVVEERNGCRYVLASTLITFLARRPKPARPTSELHRSR